ncbi:MAG: serpin family protein [Cyclobacteriaceae bacterium]|nr:serpin family protein [Cyclobacteriaceae bacterium]
MKKLLQKIVNLFSLTGKLLPATVFLCSMTILISSCEITPEPGKKAELRNLTEIESELIRSNNRLAADVFKALYQSHPDANLVYSPFSLSTSLGALQNGTKGEAQDEISGLLNTRYLSPVALNKTVSELLNLYRLIDRNIELSMASSLWHSDELRLNHNYENIIMAYYDTEVRVANFGKENAGDLVNRWSELRTKGHSGKVLQKIAPEARLFWISTISMPIQEIFSKGNFAFAKGDFKTHKGSIINSSYIAAQQTPLRSFRDQKLQYYELPMGKGMFQFCIAMPDEKYTLSEIIQTYRAEDMDFYHEMAMPEIADISFPAFKSENSLSLNEVLKSLGVNEIFSNSGALSEMITESPNYLHEMRQKVLFDISAPIAAQVLSKLPAKVEGNKSYHIDRPFMYMVRDRHTGGILMQGFVSNP